MSRILDTTSARQSTDHLASLLRSDREATANFVVALAEFDRHRHWVPLGYNCLFNFVHRELRMSRSAAFFRTKAAEIVQRFPEVVEPLRDGRLCLTAIAQLAKVINERNRGEILPRFFERSNQAARELVAELAPVLNPPRREVITSLSTVTHPRASRLPGLPSGGTDGQEGHAGPCSASSDSRPEPLPPSPAPPPADDSCAPPASHEGTAANDPAPADAERGASGNVVETAATPASASTSPMAVIDGWTEPLTDELRRLHVTVTKEFLRKLATARDALAHFRSRRSAAPTSRLVGRYAEVLEAGLDLILARDLRNKGLTSKPRREPRPSAPDHIPAHVRREVGERDHWECQYPLASGGICGSKRNLQIDHIHPESQGGEAVAANLRVLCAVHNVLAARLALGDDVMDRYTRRARVP